MKRIFSIAAICGLILTVSCKKDGTAVEKDFKCNVPSTAVAGQTVKFEDLSLGVSSREWTFQDAEPATSTAASVEVKFKEIGDKAVKLKVNFSDGTYESKDFTVKVLGSLNADIKVEGLTPKGCAKKGKAVTFSLENVEGEPTSYSWTFQGGTPETSTEASPSVTWNSQIDDVKITCELTRAGDGAKTTVETSIIAGNYPLLRKTDEYDVFGFEGNVRDAYICYAKDGDQPNKAVLVDGGSNSSRCMKVDASAYTYMPVPGYESMNGFIDLFHRNNWTNNATMEVGKRYVMSFDIKASAPKLEDVDLLKVAPSIGQMNKGELGAVMEIAWIYCCTPPAGSDLYDYLRDAYTSEDWKEYYGTDYVSQKAEDTTLHEFRYTRLFAEKEDNSDLHFENLIKSDWQTLSDEFTLEVAGANAGDLFYNCFICVRCSGYGATFYLDNFRIDEVE